MRVPRAGRPEGLAAGCVGACDRLRTMHHNARLAHLRQRVSCPRRGHKSHSYDLRHELGPGISGELRVRSAEPGTMAHQLVCKIVPDLSFRKGAGLQGCDSTIALIVQHVDRRVLNQVVLNCLIVSNSRHRVGELALLARYRVRQTHHSSTTDALCDNAVRFLLARPCHRISLPCAASVQPVQDRPHIPNVTLNHLLLQAPCLCQGMDPAARRRLQASRRVASGRPLVDVLDGLRSPNTFALQGSGELLQR